MSHRELLLDSVEKYGYARVSWDFLNTAFPEPRRPTREEIMLSIMEKLGGASVLDRQALAHIYQPTQEEQIEEFCQEHGLKVAERPPFYDRLAPETLFLKNQDYDDRLPAAS